MKYLDLDNPSPIQIPPTTLTHITITTPKPPQLPITMSQIVSHPSLTILLISPYSFYHHLFHLQSRAGQHVNPLRIKVLAVQDVYSNHDMLKARKYIFKTKKQWPNRALTYFFHQNCKTHCKYLTIKVVNMYTFKMNITLCKKFTHILSRVR